jgi:hypothetical protein
MNTEYRHLLPADFDPGSRVWIYQCNRLLSMQEALQAEAMMEQFLAAWNTHGTPIKGWASLFFGRFVVLMADETRAGVSGCSTDSSVRLIKSMESAFNVSLFDRQLLAFQVKEKIELIPLSQFGYAVQNGFITADSIYFNNLVATKSELENNWMIPVKDSWLAKKLPATAGQS